MLYVLAYPQFGPDDLAIIEKFRAEFEPQRAAMIRSHLTLMFGTTAVREDEVARLAKRVASTAIRFRIVFAGLESVHDPLEGTQKLFLLPTTGGRRITEMHDALYAGLPSETLNADIPYAPHVTIATSDDQRVAQTALAAAAEIPLPISGTVDALAVVEVIGRHLRPVVQFPLAP
jgi:2'-5' RNA ligase